MTLSTDTIRTVIEILPDWEILELPDYSTFAVVPPAGSGICDCSNVQNFPLVLDALAAAAVRVIEDKGFGFDSDIYGTAKVWEQGCAHPNTAAASAIDKASVWCPDCERWVSPDSDGWGRVAKANEYRKRTENTLKAIAEFVKGGGFDQKKAEQGDYIPGQDRSGKSGGFESE